VIENLLAGAVLPPAAALLQRCEIRRRQGAEQLDLAQSSAIAFRHDP
jgi:hypothetical protein